MKGWIKETSFWLVVVGAVVWGLTIFGFNPVESIFGTTWAKFIYGAVGISGLVQLWAKFGN